YARQFGQVFAMLVLKSHTMSNWLLTAIAARTLPKISTMSVWKWLATSIRPATSRPSRCPEKSKSLWPSSSPPCSISKRKPAEPAAHSAALCARSNRSRRLQWGTPEGVHHTNNLERLVIEDAFYRPSTLTEFPS